MTDENVLYFEWEKTTKYLADHRFWATYHELMESGPEKGINYAALRDEKDGIEIRTEVKDGIKDGINESGGRATPPAEAGGGGDSSGDSGYRQSGEGYSGFGSEIPNASDINPRNQQGAPQSNRVSSEQPDATTRHSSELGAPVSPIFRPVGRRIRHLHLGFGTPSIADPMGIIKIVETSTARDPSTLFPTRKIMWTGWRASLLTWLVNRLLPLNGYDIDNPDSPDNPQSAVRKGRNDAY